MLKYINKSKGKVKVRRILQMISLLLLSHCSPLEELCQTFEKPKTESQVPSPRQAQP